MENSLTKWTIGNGGKLKLWRELREEIKTLSLDVAIHTAYQWWNSSPTVRRTFDPWKIESWPNPWNLLYQDDQCPNSIILGVYYTCKLAEIDMSMCQLSIINDIEQRQNCMAIIIDSSTAITYNRTMDANDPEVVEVLNIFTENDLISLIK
jgi:hypothetical protein